MSNRKIAISSHNGSLSRLCVDFIMSHHAHKNCTVRGSRTTHIQFASLHEDSPNNVHAGPVHIDGLAVCMELNASRGLGCVFDDTNVAYERK